MKPPSQKKPWSFRKLSAVGGLAAVSLSALVFLVIFLIGNSSSPGTASQTSGSPGQAKPKETEVITEFIRRYFSTWSKQDMNGYDDCFLPDASIHYLDSNDAVTTYTRKQFVAFNTDFHKKTEHATEVAESIDIHFSGKLAHVLVFWKLTIGDRRETGYDHFTLLKDGGNWGIINLTYYGSEKRTGQTKPEEKEVVTKFIHRYFSTWSTKDMKGYDDCFWPDASIHYIGADDALTPFTRKDFVAQQTKFQKEAVEPRTEVAESVDIRFDGKLAHVVVFWKLTAGDRRVTGYDHFTLLKVGENWRIVNLTFYSSDKLDRP